MISSGLSSLFSPHSIASCLVEEQPRDKKSFQLEELLSCICCAPLSSKLPPRRFRFSFTSFFILCTFRFPLNCSHHSVGTFYCISVLYSLSSSSSFSGYSSISADEAAVRPSLVHRSGRLVVGRPSCRNSRVDHMRHDLPIRDTRLSWPRKAEMLMMVWFLVRLIWRQ
jgi:hypothetical protein